MKFLSRGLLLFLLLALPLSSISVEAAGGPRKGLFGVSQKKDQWMFHIPDSLMGRRILVTVRFTTTPAGTQKYGGEQVNQQTVYWEKAPNGKLLLRSDLFINMSDSIENINRAVITSNSNPIIGSFTPEEYKNGVSTINVTNFFNDDNPALSIPASAKQKFGLQSYMGGLSFIESIRTFPLNTEVRTTKTWYSSTGTISARATGKVTLGLNVSFVLLPADPIIPRLFDPRVGYFTDSYNVFDDNQQRVSTKSFITRYRLEPKDSADMEKMRRGELVEPKKPIVYYIDPATPKKWRKYLIDGVNDWQKAFEKAGFKNAIVGREWPENDSTMSMEDARFSVIRYLASDIPNAYGPQVHDPRTGEILESHVCWYHNVMKLVHDWYMIQASTIDEAARRMKYDDELMGQLIRFVSSHEVGHSLGLRHNFGSSAMVPVDSLRSKAWVEAHGHTPSIMDYARFNYVAQPEDSISHAGIFPRINDYDIWAIQWGYTPMFDAYDTESDHWELERLVQEADLPNHPRLWFGDGETNRTRDSRCQTEDLGDDAVKASEYGIRNLKRELKQLPEWTYQSNDIYQDNLRGVYQEIIGQFLRYCGHVIGYIGGCCYNYRTIDEGGPYYTLIPRKRQLESVEYLDRHIFHEPTWLTSEPFVATLVPNRQALSSNIGKSILNSALNVLPSLNDEYPSSDYLNDLTNRLFGELKTGAKLTPYRRDLQRLFVMVLCENYSEPNMQQNYYGDVLLTLRRLQREYKAARPADQATRAFYAAMIDILDRKLEIK